jgi:hypothetical protein
MCAECGCSITEEAQEGSPDREASKDEKEA